MQLVQFKLSADGNSVHLKFSDGYEADISLQKLRDNCPCASCKGEEVLLRKYEPLNKTPVAPSGYLLENAVPVGNYAIQIVWKDGHNTGIYTWEHLKKISQKNNTYN